MHAYLGHFRKQKFLDQGHNDSGSMYYGYDSPQEKKKRERYEQTRKDLREYADSNNIENDDRWMAKHGDMYYKVKDQAKNKK